jgi:organic hydroperoxide reductase OsmC/OhrA
MAEITIQLRNIHGTRAALGWAGSHTVVVDRPEGTAGGNGLGFNGGQLLGLSIGGCLCNDLQYVAHDLGARLTSVEVDVTIRFAGEPTLATGATVALRVETEDKKVDTQRLIEQAVAISTIVNSLQRAFPIQIAGANSR